MTIPTQIRFVMPLVVAVLTTASFGQSVLYTLVGDGDPDAFGYRVSGAGDVNGDGVPDLIVGSPGDEVNGVGASGSARVFSGLDGSLIYTFGGDQYADRLGVSVSGAGDVDGDGFADLIVGSNRSPLGYARVYSGKNGSIIYTFFGDAAFDDFGRSVSGAGDVDGDGFDDMIVGARSDDTNATNSGYARVFSGQDGSIIYTFYGAAVFFDSYGFSVSGAGDVDGDGFDDLIVGAIQNATITGRAEVLSGANGSILYTFSGNVASDGFGGSVSGAGDVNGDGFADLIVGASRDDNNGSESGSARVFSGADGSILYTFDGDAGFDSLGSSVGGAGDVNGDGFADLIVGAALDDNNGKTSGSARVFSGADGAVLFTVDGDSVGDALGLSVSGAGDIDGDGFADLIVGAPQNHQGAGVVGYARV
ncbi:MAG: FG-GAP repeat protein, partial [Chloroflexi bacterium]|nr:FG-GAP repeat protein [Chloroflexota bacterium]